MLRLGASRTLLYGLLTVLALAAVVLFVIRWLSAPGKWEYPGLYIAASFIGFYYVAVWFARWTALARMRRPLPVATEPGLRVAVATTFVPGAEPPEMLQTTLEALLRMDYPHDTWVLDEGDDPEVRALCQRLGARHFTRRHDVRYQTASGSFAAQTKHGNYNAWLTEQVYGAYDVVVTFDLDHVPRRDYLNCLLGYFRDPGVGYVQAPPVYYNQEASFIARGAAEETYAYHSSHQMASYALGHPVVVGSHSVHRVAALQAVGGFPAHDAEDLYLTMLYRANHWRGVYVPRIVALGATPVDWPGYLRQQVRWARAVLDLKLRAFPALASQLTKMERVLNLFHGVYYLRPLALFVALLMLLAMLVQNSVPPFFSMPILLSALGVMVVLAVTDRFRQRFYFDPERERGIHWRAIVLQVAKWPHLVFALIDAARNRRVGYVITPKITLGRPARVLTPPHLGIAALVALAAVGGLVLQGGLTPMLWVLAGVAIGASLLLVWSESWRYPPPYEPGLRAERLTLMRLTEPEGSPRERHQDRRRIQRRRNSLKLVPRTRGEERRQKERRVEPRSVIPDAAEACGVTTDPHESGLSHRS